MLDKQIAIIEAAADEAGEKLDELESADADQWTSKRAAVDLALSELDRQIAEARQMQ